MTRNNKILGTLFICLLFFIVLYYCISYGCGSQESFDNNDDLQTSGSPASLPNSTDLRSSGFASKDYVFIMTRHVNSEDTDRYWKESYQNIRKSYPEKKIVIIDDNSKQEYIKNNIELKNTEIVKSEFPGRGELLPYYYFHKNKYANRAVIIHDSIFFRDFIDFTSIEDEVMPFWHHDHQYNEPEKEKGLIRYMDNSEELLNFYDQMDKWYMTFGVMSMIDYPFLDKIQKKYNIFKLLDVIKTRTDRMCLERIFGLICHKEYPKLVEKSSYFGLPRNWGYTFERYINDIRDGTNPDPVIKVWTGR